MRRKVRAFVIGVKVSRANGFVFEPQFARANHIAHRCGQNAVIDRRTIGVRVRYQKDLVRRVCLLLDFRP